MKVVRLLCIVFLSGWVLGATAFAQTGCVTGAATTGLSNVSFAAQTGIFTVVFDATPSASAINASAGLTQASQTDYHQFSMQVRFAPGGLIDARDGAIFDAAASIPYSGSQTYRFRLAGDTNARTYSAYVTPPAGVERTIGTNLLFRDTANGVPSLDNLGIKAFGGSVTVCNISVSNVPLTVPAKSFTDKLTLTEKVTQVQGVASRTQYRVIAGLPQFGIPSMPLDNGPAGAAAGGPGHQGPATALPAPISLAATWDVNMARLFGTIAGSESKHQGNAMIEAPALNIARVPQSGRTFENYGEDPYLAGRIAVNTIEGVQSQRIIAEAKHFASNNQEADRNSLNAIIDERTLREIYLPAFEATVKEAHVGAVMCAYNQINGVHLCENQLLLNQILKTEWAFDGFVTSDFGANHSTVAAANSGLDAEMPTGAFFQYLPSAVASGQVTLATVDDKLIRRYSTMMRMGVFAAIPVTPIPAAQDGVASRQIAEQGIVLLQNRGGLLPLNAAKLHKIALIGPYATHAITGGGGSSIVTPLYTVSPLAGLQTRSGPGVSVTLIDGSNISQAAALAASSDVAIVMVGDSETEGQDHPLALSGTQDQLVESVTAANPNTVVVLKTGSPCLMPWVQSVPAILEAWYPGEEDGNAVAAVLFGDVNPSGKLPVTFPARESDLPANTPAQYPGIGGVATYSEGVFVGYRHFQASGIAPLFPFGYGGSYTTFAYQNLVVTPGNPIAQSITQVDFDITNTGPVSGSDVGQVYVGMPSATVTQPPMQLKGFAKVSLRPGQSTHLHLLLDGRAFSYWDATLHEWRVAPGSYQIYAGPSSSDIRLRQAINVQ